MHVILNLCVCTNQISQVFLASFLISAELQVPTLERMLIQFVSSLSQKPSKGNSPSTFHLKAPLWIFKETSISLLLFLPQDQLFHPVTLFIALILFISIILKLISTQIYPFKSRSLYLSLKRFHKISRSSFREIVIFCM